jgi:hypothetical protein
MRILQVVRLLNYTRNGVASAAREFNQVPAGDKGDWLTGNG